MFGLNTQFRWSGTVSVLTDLEIPAGGSGPVSQRTQTAALWTSPTYQLWQFQAWESDAINIYFVGNVQPGNPPSDPRAILAATIDPAEPGAFGEFPAYIRINDGGFDKDFGFDPGRAPAELLAINVLEHEMTHYLGRFKGDTFEPGPTQRVYDNPGEHVPSGSNNILAMGPFPLPLNIPGSATVASPLTEKYEIWTRINEGLWNSP